MQASRSAAGQASRRRQEAMNFAMKRKEEFIGARVPKALKEKIISRAQAMDIPVSLLLRRVLEEVFLESPGQRGSNLINTLRQEADNNANNLKDKRFEQVLGWNPMELQQNVECVACGQVLRAGQSAFMALGNELAVSLIVCAQCKEQLQNK